MKKLLLALCLALFSFFSYAQDENSKAISLYAQAEDEFNNENYLKAYELLNQASSLLKSPDSKILYLKITTLNQFYSQNINYAKDLENTLDEFFKLVDKNNYPVEKYMEATRVKSDFEFFLKNDKKSFNDINSKYLSLNKNQYSNFRSTVENYSLSNPATYYKSELQSIINKIDQYNERQSRIQQKKDFLKNELNGLAIGFAYGIPYGIQKEAFSPPTTKIGAENFFNGANQKLGVQSQMRLLLFGSVSHIYTNHIFSLGIFKVLDLEIIKFNWESNQVLYREKSSGDEILVKKLAPFRTGLSLGPIISFGINKKAKFDIFYNIRPGIFPSTRTFVYYYNASTNQLLNDGSFDSGASAVQREEADTEIDFKSFSALQEIGCRFVLKGFSIGSYYTFGNYKFLNTKFNNPFGGIIMGISF